VLEFQAGRAALLAASGTPWKGFYLLMNAEIITIGTELLLGETVDTNSAHIARALRDIGLDLYYQTTVGDNKERVAAVIMAALNRAEVVITTGGLGPTEDDVTREAVAAATGLELEFRADLFEQIQARYERWGTKMAPTNRQQAFVPAGAIALENPVGTAPCFIVETDRGVIISLPGVPREMEHMLQHRVLPYLKTKLGAPAVILSRALRTAGIGESQIDATIRDLERGSNPTVGLAAHAGQTDIRVTAKATTIQEAEAMIEPLVREIRHRLGVSIYGEGQESVEEVLVRMLEQHGLTLAVVEVATDGLAGDRLSALPAAGRRVPRLNDFENWADSVASLAIGQLDQEGGRSAEDRAELLADSVRDDSSTDLGLAILIERTDDGRLSLAVGIASPDRSGAWARGYGGPPEYAQRWATTYGFDRLRRWLLNVENDR
jgi:nicotinamide-nucleotide amidase